MPVKGAMHRYAATPLTAISPNDEDDQAEISSRVQISAIDNNETIWQYPGGARKQNGSGQLRSSYVRTGNRDPRK